MDESLKGHRFYVRLGYTDREDLEAFTGVSKGWGRPPGRPSIVRSLGTNKV